MRSVRRLRKNWKPFWVHVWRHEATWADRGQAVVGFGYGTSFALRDRWQAYSELGALSILLLLASFCHLVRCYRASLRPDDDDTGSDRFEVIDGRDTFRRYPWLRR